MKKHRIVLVVALVVLLAAGAWLSWSHLVDQSSTPKHQGKTLVKTATKTTQKLQLALPGTAAIDARIEDYNSPTSLWTIVSKKYPLADQTYRPTDLTLTDLPARSDKSNDEKSVRSVIVPDLTELFAAAKTAGYDMMIASGFRSYELQQTYFTSYSKAYGEEKATTFSARPGQSEHQTGMALDVAYVDRNCYIDTCFGETPLGKWLAANSYKYGFILRYPADKTAITQYEYEPWHFRYVGKPLANALHESGLTLDEARPYLEKIRSELLTEHKITE